MFGYQGKQVRDNIHSADLIHSFDCFFQQPRVAAVTSAAGDLQGEVVRQWTAQAQLDTIVTSSP